MQVYFNFDLSYVKLRDFLRLKQYCCLKALFMSSREKTGPLIRVSNIYIGSIRQLRLVLPIIMFNCRSPRTIFSDSSFLSITTGLINVFPVAREPGFTCAEISKCVRISSKYCTRSSNCKGIRVA